jgi:hypothetical protein
MLVLFDNGTPRTLARYLIDRHTVTEARARGWERLSNGELLAAAEAAGFEVLVTTDKNLRHQQNLSGRKIAIVVIGLGRWKLIQPRVSQVVWWTFPMSNVGRRRHSSYGVWDFGGCQLPHPGEAPATNFWSRRGSRFTHSA